MGYKVGKGDSIVDQIVAGIKNYVLDHNLKAGDKLPNEFELSEIFGSSRNSVREAIKILVSYGVLEVRRGDGTYVCAVMGTGVFDRLFFQIVSMGMDISELIQLREILENGILKNIIRYSNRGCLKQLRGIQQKIDAGIREKEDTEQLMRLDLEFHKCLAEAAENSALEKVYNSMLEIFTPFIRYSYIIQDKKEDYSVTNRHELIMQAIDEMDGDLAKYAIRQCMKDWMELNSMYRDYTSDKEKGKEKDKEKDKREGEKDRKEKLK